jgi:hypothetical protein
MICQANGSQKQAGLTTFISNKKDIKPKLFRRDKECHYISLKRTNHQMMIHSISQTLPDIKEQVGSGAIIVSDLNATLSL